jgi:hypothetical protein
MMTWLTLPKKMTWLTLPHGMIGKQRLYALAALEVWSVIQQITVSTQIPQQIAVAE